MSCVRHKRKWDVGRWNFCYIEATLEPFTLTDIPTALKGAPVL